MPYKPKKIKRSWQPERKAFGRRVDNSKFYNSTKWRKVSLSYREKNPFCECNECKELNRALSAEVCDHKKGLQYLLDNGLDPYDFDELQSMAHKCHNKKSGKQAHGYKEKK